jgi:thioredoxin-related protein
MDRAARENKHVVLFFEVDWSGWVDVMDRKTWKEPAIVALMHSDFLAVRVDAESETPIPIESGTTSGVQLSDEYQVGSFPTTWFLTPTGQRVGGVPGYIDPTRFLEYLEYVRDRSYEDAQ